MQMLLLMQIVVKVIGKFYTEVLWISELYSKLSDDDSGCQWPVIEAQEAQDGAKWHDEEVFACIAGHRN